MKLYMIIIILIILLLILYNPLKPHNLLVEFSQDRNIFKDKESIFPYSRVLEANWKKIYFEFENMRKLITNDFNILRNFYSEGGDTFFKDWSIYPIITYEHPVKEIISLVPETYNLINKCKDITTAFFSVLKPQKIIPSHYGPTKTILRYHLGLKVPKDKEKCYIVVGNEVYWWTEGEGVLFDETFLHNVYNNTDEERVVLFIDIKRPMNTSIGNIIRDFIIKVIGVSNANQKSLTDFLKK